MGRKVLQTERVTKRFGGLTALNQVTMHVEEGEIVGLIGPNGAGKTTLFNTVAGAYYATDGKVFYDGEDITHMQPGRRCRMGIGRTFQITKPFGSLTVLENVAIGAMFGKNEKINSMSRALKEKSFVKAEEILEFMEMSHKKDAKAGTLNVPERKRLEICRALATDPKLLLLDEVVAGLNSSEVGGMVELIRRVNKRGVTVLMIEHVMKAVMQLANRIYVLNFGELLAEGTPEQVVSDPVVIEAYLGKIGQREAKRC